MTRFRPTLSSVIAVFAVIVAMSGTAVAASHITASKIKKHSISGNRLKNDTLGGKQINENKLGVVPLAGSSRQRQRCLHGAGFTRSPQAGALR